MTDNEFKTYEHVVKSSAMLDTLIALVERGPVWAGDLPSKVGRAELVALGLAFHTLVKGDSRLQSTDTGRDLYCYYFGNSDTVAEAKAFRIARRAMHSMKQS